MWFYFCKLIEQQWFCYYWLVLSIVISKRYLSNLDFFRKEATYQWTNNFSVANIKMQVGFNGWHTSQSQYTFKIGMQVLAK
jgi:hypothetical protein